MVQIKTKEGDGVKNPPNPPPRSFWCGEPYIRTKEQKGPTVYQKEPTFNQKSLTFVPKSPAKYHAPVHSVSIKKWATYKL